MTNTNANTDLAGTPEPADLLARRTAAIEESGWGARFEFFQPRNLNMWVYLLLVVLGARELYQIASPTTGVFAKADIAGVASASTFCLLFLLFLHRTDRYERTPALLAATAFIGGGIGATWAMALPGNAAVMNIYTKTFGQVWAADWNAGLTAPFVEESAKGAVFLLMLGLAPFVIRTVYDGLIVGAYVGLGFQVLEDMLYGQNSAYSNFGVDQVGTVVHTFVIRSLSGIASHAMYTAIFSAGIVYLIGTRAQPRQVSRGLLLMLSAVLVHGLWDSMLALSNDSGYVVSLLMVGITVVSFVVLITALRWGAHRERGWLHDVLAPEVASGAITELEMAALAGERARRRRDRKAALKGRPEGVSRRCEKHVLAAGLDLAHDLSESDGRDSPAVEHSRAEIQRLRAR